MIMKKWAIALVFCLSILISSTAQRIAVLKVDVPPGKIEIPVSVNLDVTSYMADSSLVLMEVRGDKKVRIPYQFGYDGQRTLSWVVNPGKVEKHLTYELTTGKPLPNKGVEPVSNGDALTLVSDAKDLLRYNYKTVYPPAGVDSAYKRSGFIHPLWSPHGQVLTRIQPKDHYHHYGIWNPWTHVLYKGDTIDFWNLRSRKGLVRFAKFISITGGAVFGEFQALHEHVVLRKNDQDEVAINELQTVRVYNPGGKDYYIADLTFRMNCATSDPVLLLKYRYGGFGWRTTGEWNKDNSEVLTSEGMTRKNADGTKARWCIVQGAIKDDYAGVVMMSYPTNYNHPEPLRIWPENMYDRGDMFANFSPTKDKDWLLEPGKDYVLKYRLIVFNGKFTKEEAESAWQTFVTPLEVAIERN
jgi:Family of unknown function (DUF6807)